MFKLKTQVGVKNLITDATSRNDKMFTPVFCDTQIESVLSVSVIGCHRPASGDIEKQWMRK